MKSWKSKTKFWRHIKLVAHNPTSRLTKLIFWLLIKSRNFFTYILKLYMLIYINIHINMGLLSCCSMHVFIILTHYRHNYEILSHNFDLQSQTIWWLTDSRFHNLLSHNFDFLPRKFRILFPLPGSAGLPYIVVGSWAEIFGLSTDGFTLRPSHLLSIKVHLRQSSSSPLKFLRRSDHHQDGLRGRNQC